MFDPELTTCQVCLEEFALDCDVVRMPCEPGKHYFHPKCIATWIQRYQKCPLCRATVASVEEDRPRIPINDDGTVRVRRSSVRLLRSDSTNSLGSNHNN